MASSEDDTLDAPSTASGEGVMHASELRERFEKQSLLLVRLHERWLMRLAAYQELAWQWTDAATSEYMTSCILLLATPNQLPTQVDGTSPPHRTPTARASPPARASVSPSASRGTSKSHNASGRTPPVTARAPVALQLQEPLKLTTAQAPRSDKLLGQLEGLHEVLMEHITHVAPVLRLVSPVKETGTGDQSKEPSSTAAFGASLALLLHQWAPTLTIKDVEARAARQGDRATAALLAAAEVIETQGNQIAALRRALYTAGPSHHPAAGTESTVGAEDAHTEATDETDDSGAVKDNAAAFADAGCDVEINVETASTIHRTDSDVSGGLAASEAGSVKPSAVPSRRPSLKPTGSSASLRSTATPSQAKPAQRRLSATPSVSSTANNVRPNTAVAATAASTSTKGPRASNGSAASSPQGRSSREGSRDPASAPAETSAALVAVPTSCRVCDARKAYYLAAESHDASDGAVDRFAVTSALSSSGDATSSFAFDATNLVLTLRQTLAYLQQAAAEVQVHRLRADALAVDLAATRQQCAIAKLAGAWTPASYSANRVNEAVDAMRVEYEAALRACRQQQAHAEREAQHMARKLAKTQRQLASERDALLVAEQRAQSLATALADAALNVALAPLPPLPDEGW